MASFCKALIFILSLKIRKISKPELDHKNAKKKLQATCFKKLRVTFIKKKKIFLLEI